MDLSFRNRAAQQLIALFGIVWLASACTDVIELDLPEPKTELVVNGTFTPDSAWSVEVSTSQSSLNSNPYRMVSNATVEVYSKGQLVAKLPHMGNGKYSLDGSKPLALEQYTLKVSAPGLPNCQATDVVPAQPAASNFKAKYISGSKNPQMQEVELAFTLADAPGATNYYYINAFVMDTAHTGEVYKNFVNVELQSPIKAEFSLDSRYFFSDKFIDGQNTTLTLRYERQPKGKIIQTNITQISADYYTYSRTLEKQSYRDNFLTTPTPVQGNIKNGYGLFAGYNTKAVYLRH